MPTWRQRMFAALSESAGALSDRAALLLAWALRCWRRQILRAREEHLAHAFTRVEPDQRQGGKFALEPRAAGADFADQRALPGQMAGRFAQDAADNAKSVASPFMGEARFGGEFGREGVDRRRLDIGRVGQDDIVAPGAYRCEQIALAQRNALAEAMIVDIAPCDRQGVGR